MLYRGKVVLVTAALRSFDNQISILCRFRIAHSFGKTLGIRRVPCREIAKNHLRPPHHLESMFRHEILHGGKRSDKTVSGSNINQFC